MASCINQYNLLQNTIELFIDQLIILNNKIDKLEEKINHININSNHININSNHINNKHIDQNIKQHINIDWDSIHLY